MAMFVLDTSIAASWCFKDEYDDFPQRLLERLSDVRTGDLAVVPSLWFVELANTLDIGEKRRRVAKGRADELLSMVGYLQLEIEIADLRKTRETLRISQSQGITVYDASYLEVCLRRSLPIASKDADMLRAAGALGVPLV